MQNVVHDDWVQSYGKQNVLVIYVDIHVIYKTKKNRTRVH